MTLTYTVHLFRSASTSNVDVGKGGSATGGTKRVDGANSGRGGSGGGDDRAKRRSGVVTFAALDSPHRRRSAGYSEAASFGKMSEVMDRSDGGGDGGGSKELIKEGRGRSQEGRLRGSHQGHFNAAEPSRRIRSSKDEAVIRRSYPGLQTDAGQGPLFRRSGGGGGDISGGRDSWGSESIRDWTDANQSGVPPAVLWTTVSSVYNGRTIVVNFRDSALTDELRGFVQVC